MSDEQQPIVPPADPEPKKKRGFTPGHPRYGGRKKNVPTKTWIAREIADRNDFQPLEWIIKAVKTGTIPGPPGKPDQVVSVSDRTRLAETVLSFLLPRLQSTQVVGPDQGPVQIEALSINQIISNPELCSMAQNLSLALSGYPAARPQLAAGTLDPED